MANWAKLTLRAVTPENYPEASETPFLQSQAWARHKAAFGWTPRYFAIDVADQTWPLLVLVRPVLGRFKLAYVAHGPSESAVLGLAKAADGDASSALKAISLAVRQALGPGFLALRWEPEWLPPETPAAPDVAASFPAWRAKILMGTGLRKAPGDVQPPDTVIISIEGDTETLLNQMRSKTRYNIRLAEKKGVQVRLGSLADTKAWYELYRTTAERDRISIHSFAYYERLLADNADRCELLLADHESDLLAGIVVWYQGPMATYLYGASSNLKRQLMPAYALQWAAIERAKRRGCVKYDLFGLPPAADEGHPMFGLYQFKTGFGGALVHRPGAWDLPGSALPYTAFRLVESARFYYYRYLRKR